jgi:hypothetical protein
MTKTCTPTETPAIKPKGSVSSRVHVRTEASTEDVARAGTASVRLVLPRPAGDEEEATCWLYRWGSVTGFT